MRKWTMTLLISTINHLHPPPHVTSLLLLLLVHRTQSREGVLLHLINPLCSNIHHHKKPKLFISHSKLLKMEERLAGYESYHSFMDKLTEAGVDDYIDLPMIAVMGDTSSVNPV